MAALDLPKMLASAEQQMGRRCTPRGTEHRDFAGKAFDMLFFQCEYEEFGTEYRYQIWIDGQPSVGGII